MLDFIHLWDGSKVIKESVRGSSVQKNSYILLDSTQHQHLFLNPFIKYSKKLLKNEIFIKFFFVTKRWTQQNFLNPISVSLARSKEKWKSPPLYKHLFAWEITRDAQSNIPLEATVMAFLNWIFQGFEKSLKDKCKIA